MEPTHEDVHEAIAAYVLGAVPEDEIPAIRAHILACEECMAAAESFSEVTATLATAVEPADVPDGFADRVMAQVADSREPATVDVTERALRRTRPRWVPALSFAALALVAAVLGAGLVMARGDLAEHRDALAALASGEGIALEGPRGARAVVASTGGGGVLVARGLEQPPAGRTYQLWLMEPACLPGEPGPCEGPVSAGTFGAADELVVVDSTLDPDDYGAAAVTIEPEGGSEQPTTAPVLAPR